MKKVLIPLFFFALTTLACRYIVVPPDLIATPTPTASKGWYGLVTNISKSDSGDLRIDLAVRNDTLDWSSMQADEGKPAVLSTSEGKKTNCDAVFVGTGGVSLAPGFQIRGFTAGTKKDHKTQPLYVECKGGELTPGAKLAVDYSYVTGPYDLHVPSVPVSGKMEINLDQVAKDVKYPIAAPVPGLVEKPGDKINAINNFTLTLVDAKRTDKGLDLNWQDMNPTEYPNYVHIGIPPVVGSDGIIYGFYEDPSIADATIALQNATAEWKTSVDVPKDAAGLYILVSVETRQSKYFVSHVIDITDK